jgi:hypothetical protein
MIDLDGSETSWLVYADWLEDHDLDAAHIREPLFVNGWFFEFHDAWGVGINGINIGTVGWGGENSFGSVVGVDSDSVYPHLRNGYARKGVGFNETYPMIPARVITDV